MAKTPELLCVGEFDEQTQALIEQLRKHCEVTHKLKQILGIENTSYQRFHLTWSFGRKIILSSGDSPPWHKSVAICA